MAIISLVLSLIPLCGLTQVCAIVLGLVAHRRITRSKGSQRGYGFAIAAIVLGVAGAITAAVLFLLPTLLSIEEKKLPDQLGDGMFVVRANYRFFGLGDLASLAVARRAGSAWPEKVSAHWRGGNLELIDARNNAELVLDVDPDALRHFWRQIQDPHVSIQEELQKLGAKIGTPEEG